MGQWFRDSSGKFTLIGTGRTALIADDPIPVDKTVKLQLRPQDTGDNVRVLVQSSRDGRSCFEVGQIGANIVIRSFEFADPGSVTVHDTAAHGLAAGVPYAIEVRVANGVIEARLNGSSSPIVSYDNAGSGTPLFLGYKYFGFVSNVNGAIVLRAELCDLTPVRVERADVLVAVVGGDVFASTDGENYSLLKSQAFNGGGPVSLVEMDQKLYGVDGVHAVIIDPLTFSVSRWIPTEGTLPGQTSDGTTRATIIARFRHRLWLAGDPQDPQNLYGCRINEPLDWDVSSELIGRAFGLTAEQVGRIGQPITALLGTSRDTLGIGTQNGIWELRGDPAEGRPQLIELLNGSGISGKDAITRVAEGRAIAHTPQGVYIIPAVGEPVPLSQSVLTEGLNIAAEDIEDYHVQVRRDPVRFLLHVFMTPVETASDEVDEEELPKDRHVVYEERVGGYTPARGGWQPDEIPTVLGPTASTAEPWRGKIVHGTRDGRLWVFDDDALSDDGEPIEVRAPLTLIDDDKVARETILHRFTVLPGEGAVVNYRVWGAQTPEQAYGVVSGRYALLLPGVVTSRLSIDRKCRAPSIVIELFNDAADERFSVEQVDAVTARGRILTRRDLTSYGPQQPCTPQVTDGSSESSETSESSDDPGSGYTTEYSSDSTSSSNSFGSASASSSSSSESSASSSNSIGPASTPSGFSESTSSESSESSDSTSSSNSFGSASTPPESESTDDCTIITDPIGDDFTFCSTTEPATLAPAAPGSID